MKTGLLCKLRCHILFARQKKKLKSTPMHDLGLHYLHDLSNKFDCPKHTPLKTNVTLENPHVEQEIHLHSWWIFQPVILVFKGVLEITAPETRLGVAPAICKASKSLSTNATFETWHMRTVHGKIFTPTKTNIYFICSFRNCISIIWQLKTICQTRSCPILCDQSATNWVADAGNIIHGGNIHLLGHNKHLRLLSSGKSTWWKITQPWTFGDSKHPTSVSLVKFVSLLVFPSAIPAVQSTRIQRNPMRVNIPNTATITSKSYHSFL